MQRIHTSTIVSIFQCPVDQIFELMNIHSKGVRLILNRMQTMCGKCENSADPDQTPHSTWIGSNIVRNRKMSLAIEKM